MIVIKFGGHAMGAESGAWMKEIAARWTAGEKFVIIHGGGPQIDRELQSRSIQSEFRDGFRITTPEIMDVVEMVLTGSVLRTVVRSLQRAGLPAVGITGADGRLLEVTKRDGGKYGLVGEVHHVNPGIIQTLLAGGFMPVISPVAQDNDGVTLNVNADIAAGAIAGALDAEQMLFLTDVPGIFARWPEQDSMIAEIKSDELAAMTFSGGMIPKVESVINAISSGAKSARIIDGKSLSAFQDALMGKGGTWVRR